ncbi:multisubunit sodium/proton antiporter MrpB subunit [Halopolyspora algeriensis]|uniref:Multisubunit sodium/proton antiporter MrpB subunit n=1 Tax=Halopolyspora algeriensis TaxID=1500506 RepID=A0A368VDE6_9ACTN|nr:MnhB domain-containing protein [Halopolyspora algeriensis]RCW39126.1 multisubunit sodium/proton antiporter MrpB subunit [Halopolyspora algeriensis]TQM56576.1 multisubunit sodium/proton antiporter MrpB subunit [Halopolyspora algeriensis]
MNTVISRIAARVIAPIAIGLGIWLFLRGHFSLGGGFLAAVVVGLAAVFRWVTIRARTIERIVDRGIVGLVGTGLLVMIGYGFAGFLWATGFLGAKTAHPHVPVLGTLSVPSTLLFELGIAVTVMAVVVAVIQELGRDEE